MLRRGALLAQTHITARRGTERRRSALPPRRLLPPLATWYASLSAARCVHKSQGAKRTAEPSATLCRRGVRRPSTAPELRVLGSNRRAPRAPHGPAKGRRLRQFDHGASSAGAALRLVRALPHAYAPATPSPARSCFAAPGAVPPSALAAYSPIEGDVSAGLARAQEPAPAPAALTRRARAKEHPASLQVRLTSELPMLELRIEDGTAWPGVLLHTAAVRTCTACAADRHAGGACMARRVAE